MKTITLDLSEDSAREMLNILFRKKSELQSQVATVESEIQKIRKGLGLSSVPPRPTSNGISAAVGTQSIVDSKDPLLNAVLEAMQKTPHGRAKKGQSRQIIVNYLKQRNGRGATIKEINTDTGTSYGTARRILDILKNDELVNEEGGSWKWGKSEFV